MEFRTRAPAAKISADCSDIGPVRYITAAFFIRGPDVSDQTVSFSRIGDVTGQLARRGDAYLEFLRVPSMSAGVYVLAAGAADSKAPHKQDELYYVLRGKARMSAGGQDQPVSEGSVIFIAAHVQHRFYDIEEEISLLVLFAPAEVE
jgi:quercetin dioxygenase-like cupin family protein